MMLCPLSSVRHSATASPAGLTATTASDGAVLGFCSKVPRVVGPTIGPPAGR